MNGKISFVTNFHDVNSDSSLEGIGNQLHSKLDQLLSEFMVENMNDQKWIYELSTFVNDKPIPIREIIDD